MLGIGTKRQLPTVLLIDDDMVSREVMATVLTMSGYTVHTATDGAASLKLLEAGECLPGVILMDAQMPGLIGTRLIQELRARSSATVVAISGSKAPREVTEATDGFLLKPFDAHALNRLLEEHLAQTCPAAAPAEEPVEPVVNPKTLAQLRAIMPEASVRAIYAAIVHDLDRRIEALEVAMAKGNAEEIRRIGHAIKGGCAMAGAAEAARLGALIESGKTESRDNQIDNSARLLSDLRTATHNLKRMLEDEFPA